MSYEMSSVHRYGHEKGIEPTSAQLNGMTWSSFPWMTSTCVSLDKCSRCCAKSKFLSWLFSDVQSEMLSWERESTNSYWLLGFCHKSINQSIHGRLWGERLTNHLSGPIAINRRWIIQHIEAIQEFTHLRLLLTTLAKISSNRDPLSLIHTGSRVAAITLFAPSRLSSNDRGFPGTAVIGRPCPWTTLHLVAIRNRCVVRNERELEFARRYGRTRSCCAITPTRSLALLDREDEVPHEETYHPWNDHKVRLLSIQDFQARKANLERGVRS